MAEPKDKDSISADKAPARLPSLPEPKADARAAAKSPADAEHEAAEEEVAIAGALSPEDGVMRDNSLDAVAANFHDMSVKCGPHIEELRGDLLKTDPPGWAESLLSGLVGVALGAGAAAFGELLAAKYLEEFMAKAVEDKKVSQAVGAAGRELVKSLAEQGTDKGIDTARNALAGGNAGDVIARFILAQHDGVTDMYKEAHSHFLHFGRHQIKTVKDAQALEAASNQTYDQAPQIHYERARDAWVTYVAQQKFGTLQDPDLYAKGHERQPDTTNMMDQESRDRTFHTGAPSGSLGDQNSSDTLVHPDWPRTAPNLDDALIHPGDDQGVLTIMAELPEIGGMANRDGTPNYHMDGTPTVLGTILNGVNGAIRDQYAGKPLDQIHIPRQIECRVAGDDPNFTLNLDENGRDEALHAKTDWLRHRALVGRSDAPPDAGRAEEGLRLLLHELITGKISGRT